MKTKRQTKILELIKKNDIETQEELLAHLVKDGFAVTQATVSRDIREMKLTKIATSGGKQKYAALNDTSDDMSEKFVRVLKDGYVSMDMAQNILVIKTVSGMAMAAAAALDSLELDSIVGCIAGDDTIMVAVRTSQDAVLVKDKIAEMIKATF